jgi:drug/metabolite transporter (DMT)-like permease
MKELITLDQANQLMLAATVVIPIVGLIWGVVAKQIKTGLIWGLLVGVGNLVMWKVYNAITDNLGLDTVKNLLVNLALFVVIGLIAGFVAGMKSRRQVSSRGNGPSEGPGGAEVALAAGPTPRSPGASRTIDEATEPPRDAG